MQIYVPVTRNNKSAINTLSACLDEVKSWLSKNVFFWTQIRQRLLHSAPLRAKNLPDLESLKSFISPQVQNLGGEFDNCLKFDKQISSVISFLFYLRSLSKSNPSFGESFRGCHPCFHYVPAELLQLSLLRHIKDSDLLLSTSSTCSS